MKLIPLTRGKFAMVDDDMYEYLNQWKWFASNKAKHCYAIRRRLKSDNQNLPVKIFMHRFILNVIDPKRMVDHKDRDTLNNQSANLRECTNAQNIMNKGPSGDKYKGVHNGGRGGKNIYAEIMIGGKRIFIGSYNTKEEAAIAYDKKAHELFGEFAYLNFPELINKYINESNNKTD